MALKPSVLRKANSNDFRSIYDIYMDPAVNPFMSWERMGPDAFYPIYQELLSTQALHVYEDNGEIMAVIRIDLGKYRRSHTAYIGGFGVAAAHQRKGLGLRIMGEVVQLLRDKGIKRIELIVESDNPRAIRLYKKVGFEIEGTLRKFFKRKDQANYVDDYYMSLLLM